jgi:ABC-type nitrate/sulfonate/bicarbonate transport system permease component
MIEVPAGLRNRLGFALCFVIVWWMLSKAGTLAPVLIPSPEEVLAAAQRLGLVALGNHILVTVGRSIAGFALGATLGIAIGVLIRFSRIAKAIFEPLVDAMRPVPAVALIPFFILIFGFSETGRIVLVLLAVAVILAIATAEAIESMPEAWFRYPVACGLRRRQVMTRVVLPGLVPFMKGPCRVALSVTLTIVIVSEFMGAQSGLGYLINVSRVNLSTDVIMLAVLLLGAVVQLLDTILVVAFNRASFWFIALQTGVS